MKTNRRSFITGAGAIAASAVATSAHAQGVLDEIFGSTRRGAWNEQFDARVSGDSSGAGGVTGSLVTNQPIMSPETLFNVQQAIAHYSNLAAQGGWPMVPARKRLQMGVADPDVEVLRRRLMFSGDLSERAGISPAFDTYVDAALKRFQSRHGLPADGVTSEHTFAAMNVSTQVRLGQLETNHVRLNSMANGNLGARYVMVNIPAAQIEAVEGGRVVSRHTAIVGKIDRQTPILESKINQIIVNPYWNAPVSIVRRDIIPLMRENPNYLRDNAIRLIDSSGNEVDPMTVDWSTDEATRLRFRQDPGRINAMASVKIDFPNAHSVYMHDTPQQSLFNDIERFHSSGCVRVQNVRDLVTWMLQGTEGWDRRRFEDTIHNDADVTIRLGDPVPVYFTYFSAWSTGHNVVHFRDDIYGKDGVDELQISTAL